MTAKRKPDFIIIGAVKGATTWSARALARHPGVFMPGPEPHYFSSEFERGPDWYLSLFAAAPEGALIGEKSADYLAHPEAAARMAAMVPAARLIVQLRNPVERAYSDYCMLFRRGTVRDTPADYFASGGSGAERDRFLGGGLYAAHLQRFCDRFARDQILVLLYEDIMASPSLTIDRILAHVDLTPGSIEVSDARENDSAAPLLPLGLRAALKPLKNVVRPFRGNPLFEAARGLFAREVRYPPLDAEARAFLDDYYRHDIAALESLIGRSLGAWRLPCVPDDAGPAALKVAHA